MDADLQDNPEEIPGLYNMLIDEDFDVVSGWKKKRYDNVITKNIPSKLFNLAARKTSGLKLHDKDICRSFAHELIHHVQNERGD